MPELYVHRYDQPLFWSCNLSISSLCSIMEAEEYDTRRLILPSQSNVNFGNTALPSPNSLPPVAGADGGTTASVSPRASLTAVLLPVTELA